MIQVRTSGPMKTWKPANWYDDVRPACGRPRSVQSSSYNRKNRGQGELNFSTSQRPQLPSIFPLEKSRRPPIRITVTSAYVTSSKSLAGVTAPASHRSASQQLFSSCSINSRSPRDQQPSQWFSAALNRHHETPFP